MLVRKTMKCLAFRSARTILSDEKAQVGEYQRTPRGRSSRLRSCESWIRRCWMKPWTMTADENLHYFRFLRKVECSGGQKAQGNTSERCKFKKTKGYWTMVKEVSLQAVLNRLKAKWETSTAMSLDDQDHNIPLSISAKQIFL